MKEVLYILKELGNEKDKNKRIEWIENFLNANHIQYTLDKFKAPKINQTGANILIGNFNNKNIVLSAHHDGNDFNDNLACVSLLLYFIKEHPPIDYSVIFTDFEEMGGYGIAHFAERYGNSFSILFLDLCGIGGRGLIAKEAFGPLPPFNICKMNMNLNNKILHYANKLNLSYAIYMTPPGDHFFYCEKGGSASLISLVNPVDIKILKEMSNFLKTYNKTGGIFKFPVGLNTKESVLSKIPPVGSSNLNDIQKESLEIIYKLLDSLTSKKG